MPGWVRRVAAQHFLVLGHAGGIAGDLERPVAVVLLLRLGRRLPGIDDHPLQQRVQAWRGRCRHVDADRAREHVGGLREFQVGVPGRQLPARGALQRTQLAIDGLVGGELRRARRGRWRKQRDAVGPFLGRQVARHLAAAAAEVPPADRPPTGRRRDNRRTRPAARRGPAASRRARGWMGCSWRQCNGRRGFANPPSKNLVLSASNARFPRRRVARTSVP